MSPQKALGESASTLSIPNNLILMPSTINLEGFIHIAFARHTLACSVIMHQTHMINFTLPRSIYTLWYIAVSNLKCKLKRVRPGCVGTRFSEGLILEPREGWIVMLTPRKTNRPKRALTSMCMEVTYMCRLLGLFLSPCFGRLCLHVAVAPAWLLQNLLCKLNYVEILRRSM